MVSGFHAIEPIMNDSMWRPYLRGIVTPATDPRASLQSDRTAFFRQRLVVAIFVVGAATGFLGIADVLQLSGTALLIVVIAKIGMMSALGGLILALRKPRYANRPEAIGIVGVAVICLAATITGIMRGDATATVGILTVIALGAAAVLPWGLRPQLVVAAIAGCGMLVATVWLDGFEAVTFGYRGVVIILALAVLGYIAVEFARYRRLIEERSMEFQRAK
jgi:hypothetical protein